MARILIVDDEERIRKLLCKELTRCGHEIFTVAAGDGLLGKIALLEPEVVVLDIRLGDHDGLDMLQDIRNRHYNLPVILYSAYDTYKNDPKSIAADYYVVKSFDLGELKRAIQKATEGTSAATWLEPDIRATSQ